MKFNGQRLGSGNKGCFLVSLKCLIRTGCSSCIGSSYFASNEPLNLQLTVFEYELYFTLPSSSPEVLRGCPVIS